MSDAAITATVVISCLAFAGGYVGWLIDSALEPYEPPPPRVPRRPELVPDVNGVVPGSGYNRAPKARVTPLEYDDPDTTVQLTYIRPGDRQESYRPPPVADNGPGWDNSWGLPAVPVWDPEQTQPTTIILDD